MKIFTSFLTIFAILTLSFAPFAQAGEVKKQPLKIEQAVELAAEEAVDFEDVKNTEGGIQNGYGLMGLALAVLAGYFIKEQIDDEDED
ncbi:MAG: hypothetical protein HKN23_00060 [Verrucomicrobiales bacterium]|nr:hypothetical protein [Verrucomicrobiales bacterium]